MILSQGSPAIWGALAAVMVLLTGCQKGPASGPGTAADTTAGKAVFAANNCAKCHVTSVGSFGHGEGGRGGRGVDLSRIGADATKNASWIAEHIRNPKAHNAMSKMPAFEGKISEADLAALAGYLSSLK